jgi:hypothetical protein
MLLDMGDSKEREDHVFSFLWHMRTYIDVEENK